VNVKLLATRIANSLQYTLICGVLLLSACEDSIELEHDHAHGSTTSDTEQGGDDYWAELAQSYEPVEKPPRLGAAYGPTDWINVGNWEPVFDWPLIATGAANMPDGRIVAWSSQKVDDFGGPSESTHGTIYNPSNGSFSDTPNSSHDMFCAGVSMLEDGRIFIAGGGKTVSSTSIFDDGQFSQIEPMAMTRWYPTSTTMASGQVFTSLGTTASAYPEVWTDGEGWRLLPTINLQTILDGEDVVHNDWYPALNVAPDGSLFHPGHMPDLMSIYPHSDEPVHDHGKREGENESRLYNTTVMYDIGKMLVAGGGAGVNATNAAMTIDLNGPTPIQTPTASMKHVRSMQNSVVLPNGEVLVIGGNSSGIQFSDEGTVWEPEIWNPVTEQWRVVADHEKPRNYHSVALLMKDARVLAAGGGLCGGCATNHQNGEIYSPPYLFDANGSPAARPQIFSGDSTAVAGDTISIAGSDSIEKFTMMRLVAITHHHTTDQRYVPIDSIKTGTGQYDLTLNANANVLLPGYYWIFALDQNGVPSVGHTIQINVSPNVVSLATGDASPNIDYEYFEESWSPWVLPNFDTLTPVKTGTQADFSLAQRERNNWFGFRFRGTLNVPSNGTYTFFLSSDDGSKLLINNQVVVDHDGVHNFESEKNGTINLTAGQHDIEVQYFEVGGGDALLVQWQGPQLSKSPILPYYLGSPLPETTLANSNPGPAIAGKVSYRYYEGTWNNLPNFSNETIVKEGEVAGFDLSPKLANDFYGFEYSANLTVPATGEYTFYTKSDDGSRLSLNGLTVVMNDGKHPPIEKSGTVTLAAGTHRLVVDFFEHAGGDSLNVQWAGPGFGKTTIPVSAIESNGSVGSDNSGSTDGTTTDGSTTDGATTTGTTAGSTTDTGTTDGNDTSTGKPGLVNFKYFEGNWFNLPNFANYAPVKQGESAGFVLSERNRDDFYGMQFSGKLTVPVAGLYTFYSQSDDGSRISINGQTIVSNDGRHAPIEKQGNATLSAGQHDIVVDFFEYAGGDSLQVSWAGPGFAKQFIPTSALATGIVSPSGSSAGNTDDGNNDGGNTDDGNTDGGSTDGEAGKVSYEYFEGQWVTLPDFNNLTPSLSGQLDSISLSPKQVNDNYAFRFAATIVIPANDTYTFYASSDDGSRISIDGDVLVDNDGLHGFRERSASKFLSAGSHHVLIEFFERAGLDKLDVQWSIPGGGKQPFESLDFYSADFDNNGSGSTTNGSTTSGSTTGGSTDETTPPAASDLQYEYFEGNWTTLPDFDAMSPQSTGTTAQFTLPPSNGVLYYGYRFTGQLFVETTGVYTFYSASNDGSQLFINDTLVVDNNGKHGVIEKQGAINLSAGLHDISVIYFQSNGTEALNVSWSGPGFSKKTIESSSLFKP